jgi:hypothetical protein
MSAMALLGGLSGGQGGQKFGGDAGPSTSGSAYSGATGSVGGLQFNTGGGDSPSMQSFLYPALALGAAIVIYGIVTR